MDYFILRVEPTPESARRARGGSPFENAEISGGALGAPAAPDTSLADKITVESTALSENQARDAARDPANVVAPVMPVALVAPVAAGDCGLADTGDPVAEAAATRQSWGIGDIGADKSPFTGAGVRVAILDTGITPNHPAFAGVTVIGRNFTPGDPNDMTDQQGHGTHCAGTVFGRDVDGTRIGVARGVTTAIIGKVLDANGRGSTANVLNALHWAAGQKANVISMSLGFDFPGMQKQLQDAGRPAKLATSIALKAYRENLRLFETLIAFILQESADLSGAVIVAASGNESLRQQNPDFIIDTSLPAAAANIISVGATMQGTGGLGIAPFSNVNPTLSAPGVNIVSADRGTGLVAMNGTSMACPHVAGLAALWWESATRNVGRATGALVRAQVVAAAKASGFLANVGIADRGAGRAMAPPPN